MNIQPPWLGQMSWDDYRKFDALSQSKLKLIGRTPWHYQHPDERADTPAMALGRVFHTLLLEPELFDQTYAVNDLHRSSRAYKDFAAEESREIIKTPVLEMADAMRLAILRNSDAAEFLDVPSAQEVTAICEIQGRLCKARIDRLPEIGALWDVKTFGGSARPAAFTRRCLDLKYYMQAWLYCEAVRQCTGEERGWSWIVVEQSINPAVQVYRADPTLLEDGRAEFERLLSMLEECEALDYWPNSYVAGPYTIIGEQNR